MKDEDFPVFMDVRIYQPPHERMVFELFYDVAPLTAENFRALCTGEKGTSPKTNRPLCYRNCCFHPIKRGGSYVKGAAFCYKTGGESIFGPHFPVESNELKHDEAGLLSRPQRDQKASGSDFIITLKADQSLDSTHLVFGKLVEGLDTLRAIGKYCAEMKISIFRSGVLYNARALPIDVRPHQSSAVSCQGRALVEQNRMKIPRSILPPCRARDERPSSSKPKEVSEILLPQRKVQ